MSAKRARKPCELPCAKCGSADIYRRFRKKGEEHDIGYRSTDHLSAPWIVMTSLYGRKEFGRECIVHHCRSCQFEWATAPL